MNPWNRDLTAWGSGCGSMLALNLARAVSHNRRKERSWGYCQYRRRQAETCLSVIAVTSFSVRDSVRRECGVDIVLGWSVDSLRNVHKPDAARAHAARPFA